MATFREEPARFDLDKELDRAEECGATRVMYEAITRIEPDAAFAARLEARLRAGTQSPSRSQTSMSGASSPLSPPNMRGLLMRPIVRMSFVGAALAVAVVGVFLLAILLRRDLPLLPGMAGNPGNNTSQSAALPTPLGGFSQFVPKGKVRHMVINHTNHTVGQPAPAAPDWTDEVSIANGSSHYLIRRTTTISQTRIADILVGDQSVWAYYPQAYWKMSGPDKVYKVAYDPGILSQYLPDKQFVDNLLSRTNSHAVSQETLNGVPVQVVESVGNAEPHVWVDAASRDQLSLMDVLVFPRYETYPRSEFVWERPRQTGWVTPTVQVTPVVKSEPGSALLTSIDFRLWVDGDGRILRQEYTWNPTPRNQSQPMIFSTDIVLDEMLDASDVQPDLFTFKLPDPATVVVDAVGVVTQLGPPGTAGGSGNPSLWQVYTSPGHDFSLLMPGTAPAIALNNGWRSYELSNSNVTYGAAYFQYDDAPDPANAEARLAEDLPMVVASLNGTLKSKQQITLDSHPGWSLGIQRADGTFTRARVFISGKTLYTIYGTAPDENTAYSEDLGMSRFLNSFKLLEPNDTGDCRPQQSPCSSFHDPQGYGVDLTS
ncbi:MAG: hypothetical protein ABI670_09655 [Chloroflexota bacterium]